MGWLKQKLTIMLLKKNYENVLISIICLSAFFQTFVFKIAVNDTTLGDPMEKGDVMCASLS